MDIVGIVYYCQSSPCSKLFYHPLNYYYNFKFSIYLFTIEIKIEKRNESNQIIKASKLIEEEYRIYDISNILSSITKVDLMLNLRVWSNVIKNRLR